MYYDRDIMTESSGCDLNCLSALKYENEKLLLKIIKKQLNISDNDMYSSVIVKTKIRDANIDKILED